MISQDNYDRYLSHENAYLSKEHRDMLREELAASLRQLKELRKQVARAIEHDCDCNPGLMQKIHTIFDAKGL